MTDRVGGASQSSTGDCNNGAILGDVAWLVADHHMTLYRYAYRLTGSTYDAEDLTQQAFMTAQLKLHQLRDLSRCRSWLFTILRHCYLKSRRRRLPVSAGSLELNLDLLPGELPAADLFDHCEIDRQQLQVGLDELPTEFKVVLLMFYFEECSYREIAVRLDLPLGTVMSRLSRAKHHLRNRLFATGCAGDGSKLASDR